jgi:hypothetical protein
MALSIDLDFTSAFEIEGVRGLIEYLGLLMRLVPIVSVVHPFWIEL